MINYNYELENLINKLNGLNYNLTQTEVDRIMSLNDIFNDFRNDEMTNDIFANGYEVDYLLLLESSIRSSRNDFFALTNTELLAYIENYVNYFYTNVKASLPVKKVKGTNPNEMFVKVYVYENL